MKMVFQKYHGTGNDFILIDNREGRIHLTRDEIARLCDRHFGIGADGLMLLTARNGYDFGMVYCNADGNESTMCGNGGRCITAFAKSLGLVRTTARFTASDGEHTAEILEEKGNETRVRLKMADVPVLPRQGRGSSNIEHRTSNIEINTGSPHLVVFVEDVSSIDVVTEGRKLRNDPEFAPEGINVDFVQVCEDGNLYVRTYERGVENETLSCGTGVTAAALAFTSRQSAVHSRQSAIHSLQSAVHSPQSTVRSLQSTVTGHRIETPGGQLIVSFHQEENRFTDIWLEGPAEFVYGGAIEV